MLLGPILFWTAGCGSVSGKDKEPSNAYDAAGTYTLDYDETSKNQYCDSSHDLDWMEGFLTITQDGENIDAKFSDERTAVGTIDQQGFFQATATWTETSGEELEFTATGLVSDTGVDGEPDPEADPVEDYGVLGDFNETGSEGTCRVRGTFNGTPL